MFRPSTCPGNRNRYTRDHASRRPVERSGLVWGDVPPPTTPKVFGGDARSGGGQGGCLGERSFPPLSMAVPPGGRRRGDHCGEPVARDKRAFLFAQIVQSIERNRTGQPHFPTGKDRTTSPSDRSRTATKSGLSETPWRLGDR